MFTYYSIGYPLQASGQDKVHRVKVKLRDDPAFSDYEVRYQPRFVEKSLETRVQDRVVSSLVFEIDENPMGLEVEAGTPAAATADRWLLPARLSFPLSSVALLPEGDDFVARIVLFIAARDTDGKRSDLVRQMHEIRVPTARYEDAQSKNIQYRHPAADGGGQVQDRDSPARSPDPSGFVPNHQHCGSSQEVARQASVESASELD